MQTVLYTLNTAHSTLCSYKVYESRAEHKHTHTHIAVVRERMSEFLGFENTPNAHTQCIFYIRFLLRVRYSNASSSCSRSPILCLLSAIFIDMPFLVLLLLLAMPSLFGMLLLLLLLLLYLSSFSQRCSALHSMLFVCSLLFFSFLSFPFFLPFVRTFFSDLRSRAHRMSIV